MNSQLEVDQSVHSDVLHALIDAAAKAPSPDNNQPWAFRCTDDGIDVLHVRERALPSDLNDLFSWIAVGAAIENIVLKATSFGQLATIAYKSRPFPRHAKCEHIASIRLRGESEPDPLAEFIESRVTNRKLYDRTVLSDAELQPISHAIRNSDCRVDWLTAKQDRKALSRLIRISDRVRFEHRQFHDEFHSVLRFGEEHAQSTRDGLEMKTLEVPAIAGPVFKFLRPWTRMKWANRFGLSRMFAGYSAKQVMCSGGIGLLSTSDSSDHGFLEAGRAFQRIWLATTQAGLAFQPLGALPLFLMKLQFGGPDAFAEAHRNWLDAAFESFQSLFPNASPNGLVMLFRIGHAPPPTARSVRYTIKEVLTI